MNRDDVVKRMAALAGHIRAEREIKDQLLALEFYADNGEALRQAHEQQAVLVRQLEDLRQEKMVPLIEEMVAFVASQRRAPAAGR